MLILTNPFQCYFSLSVWCACVCFVYLHYFISILCVPQEEFSLAESTQQICDFYKRVIVESKDREEISEVDF